MVYPPEVRRFQDPATSRRITQWTTHPSKNQHLYFTSPSVTLDDRWLVFISDRDGFPNLYRIDRRTGEIAPLTFNSAGLLRSYVYPTGGLRGLSKASPCLDAVRNVLYYIADNVVWGVDIPSGKSRRIADLPLSWWTAFTHISPDGKTFCVTCTPPEAFPDGLQDQVEQLLAVPAEMKRRGLSTHVYLVDTTSGQMKLHAKVPFWVTHVQFDPKGTGRIVFNQEGFTHDENKVKIPLPDRIWCLEADGSFHRLFDEPPDMWCSHENWSPAGDHIVYHGLQNKVPFVAARKWDGTLVFSRSLEGVHFIHTTMDLLGERFFIDQSNGLIQQLSWNGEASFLMPICRHDSSMKDQDAHVHPIIAPNGASLTFTSDREGVCNVYEVSLTVPPRHPSL